MLKEMQEVKFMFEIGSKSVAETQKYLKFLLDTSLGSLIPKDMLINGRNYEDYEQELLCACSIISKSLKKINN